MTTKPKRNCHTAGNPKTSPGDQRGARKGMTTMPQPNGAGSIGQAPYIPTERDRQYVRDHVFYMGQERVARRLGVCSRTLRNHFRPEIDEAHDNALLDLASTAMERAKAGDGPMLRFMLATRFKDTWSPRLKLEHSGHVDVDVNVDLSAFIAGASKDEIRIALQIIRQFVSEAGAVVVAGDEGSGAPTLGSAAAA